jgi:hypothetical protein
MTTTAGHSFYIGPIGSFFNHVNDSGSWEPLVSKHSYSLYKIVFSRIVSLCKRMLKFKIHTKFVLF